MLTSSASGSLRLASPRLSLRRGGETAEHLPTLLADGIDQSAQDLARRGLLPQARADRRKCANSVPEKPPSR